MNTYHERIHMQTKREYLVSKGITVGKRGRFSSAATKALQDAAAQGLVFLKEKQKPRK